MGTSGEKLTLDYHSRFLTDPIQSTNEPEYHTPRIEIYGPTPVPISAKKGKSFKNKTLINPIPSTGTPYTIFDKGHGPPLLADQAYRFPINPPYLEHNPKSAGTGNPRDVPHGVLVFGGVHMNIV